MYAVRAAAVLVMAALLGLFPVFSRALGMGVWNGVIAGIIWISAKVGTQSPVKNQTFALYSYEVFHAPILMAMIVSCYRRYVHSRECSSGALAVLRCRIGRFGRGCRREGSLVLSLSLARLGVFGYTYSCRQRKGVQCDKAVMEAH